MIFKPIIPVFIIVALLIVSLIAVVFCIVKSDYRHTKMFRRIAIVVLLLCTLARPCIYHETQISLAYLNLNVYFVVDMTTSMSGKDCDGGSTRRFALVADDIKTIARLFNGSRFSIIAQDYNNYTPLPLTDNIDSLIVAADALSPKNSAYTTDSDLGSLFQYASDHISSQHQQNRDRHNIIFIMTDGEDNTTSSTEVPSALRQVTTTGAVLGYGTVAGAKLNQINDRGDFLSTQIKDVVSKLNQENINHIANALSMKAYFRSSGSLSGNDFSAIKGQALEYVTENEKVYDDIYWYFAIGVIALFAWEFAYIFNKLLLERKA